MFFQGVQKRQKRRLNDKRLRKKVRQIDSLRRTKSWGTSSFITYDFFPVHFITKIFEIFFDSWGCLLYHETYLVNNHNLVPSLEILVEF